jgi:two-component system, LytTR family, response regulator
MTCLIIDDESDCLELLALLIQKHCPELTILGQYQNPREGIDAIWEQRPDLVFLDVDMPVINGFGVLDACKELPFQVVFTTAYQQYAVRAFKYSATDYLLKPIDRGELVEAVKKARQTRTMKQLAEQREVLLDNLNPAKPNREKIGLPTAEGIQYIPLAEIECCKADGNYTEVFLSGAEKPLLFVRALREIEEILEGSHFIRTHHSYLVNLKKVQQYIKGDGGYLKMTNGMLAPVSRQKKQEVLERMNRT